MRRDSKAKIRRRAADAARKRASRARAKLERNKTNPRTQKKIKEMTEEELRSYRREKKRASRQKQTELMNSQRQKNSKSSLERNPPRISDEGAEERVADKTQDQEHEVQNNTNDDSTSALPDDKNERNPPEEIKTEEPADYPGDTYKYSPSRQREQSTSSRYSGSSEFRDGAWFMRTFYRVVQGQVVDLLEDIERDILQTIEKAENDWSINIYDVRSSLDMGLRHITNHASDSKDLNENNSVLYLKMISMFFSIASNLESPIVTEFRSKLKENAKECEKNPCVRIPIEDVRRVLYNILRLCSPGLHNIF